MQPHIKIEQYPNPHRRAYHLTSEMFAGVRGGFGEDSYYGSLEKKSSHEIQQLMNKLKAVPGVVGGIIKEYEITVAINAAFEWTDVGPLILGEIVNAAFPEVLGGSILISNQVAHVYHVNPKDFGDEGVRYRYFQPLKRQAVPVDFKGGRPILDVESFFDLKELQKEKKESET